MSTSAELDRLYKIRQSGATLDRVGDRCGLSREGVRRRLTKHYGSTRVRNLLTTTELAQLTGCSYQHIIKLKRRGVIQPAMVVGRGRTLWKPETIATIIMYIDRHRCPVCQRPLPSDRHVYCSRECYCEAHRYKNQPEEAKRQHNERVKRWLEEHPGKAKKIQQRCQQRYRAKKSGASG